MPKAKKKLLPKDFSELVKSGDIAALKSVFDSCGLDARGGYGKQTALAFFGCPDELARWLVGQGADLEARNTYGRTALHEQSGYRWGLIETLIELGADIHTTDTNGDTPLHSAAKAANAEAVRTLLHHGARADALNASSLTPLAHGLQYCSNSQIEPMAAIAEALIAAGTAQKKGLGDLIKRALSGKGGDRAPVTPQLQGFMRRIGEDFEFHRSSFNPDLLDATSAALDRLYVLLDVTPISRRVVHDGRAPIAVRAGRWQDQHQELWSLLVPSHGAASTVQGEVIRIAGRVADEIDRNGGVNWDADYRAMTRAFLAHIDSGSRLSEADRDRAKQLVAELREREGAGGELCELAVRWVELNPAPVSLSAPSYAR